MASRRRSSATRLALGLLAALPLVAVTPAAQSQSRSKWWQEAEVQAELRLSAEAVQRLDEIFETMLPTLRSGWREFDRLDDAFDTLLERDDVTETEVAHELDHLEAARAALRKTRTLMLFRMSRVLTAEQRERLEAYNKRRREERGSRPGSGDDWRRR